MKQLDYIGEEGERLYKAAEQLGLEGIVAKPLDSRPYYRGRDSGWLKIETSTVGGSMRSAPYGTKTADRAAYSVPA